MKKDHCYTIFSPTQGEYKDRNSKFIAIARPVNSLEEIGSVLEILRKEHPKARHICFAYALGYEREEYRFNDAGEPSGTAGKPIFMQILSFDCSFIFVAVVRYFGGTKLGTSGLIKAYKTAARRALENAEKIDRYKMSSLKIEFDYSIMGDLFNRLKELEFEIIEKSLDQNPFVIAKIKNSLLEENIKSLKARMLKQPVASIESDTAVPHLKIMIKDSVN